MKKENLLIGIIALMSGLIIGYIGTNQLNRTQPAARAPQSGNLPADNADGANPGAGGSGVQADVAEAIRIAREQPGNYGAQMKAAGLYSEIRRFDQALEFYERAVKANPKEPEGHTRLGDTYFDLQRYVEAEGAYSESLRLQPRNATVRMDLGLTFFLRQPRDVDRAIAEFREALRLDARHEKTLQNLTSALIDKGDPEGARQTLDQLASVNPNNPAIESLRAKVSR